MIRAKFIGSFGEWWAAADDEQVGKIGLIISTNFIGFYVLMNTLKTIPIAIFVYITYFSLCTVKALINGSKNNLFTYCVFLYREDEADRFQLYLDKSFNKTASLMAYSCKV
jgi:hypothetical protein